MVPAYLSSEKILYIKIFKYNSDTNTCNYLYESEISDVNLKGIKNVFIIDPTPNNIDSLKLLVVDTDNKAYEIVADNFGSNTVILWQTSAQLLQFGNSFNKITRFG
jgi:hypothetical protein